VKRSLVSLGDGLLVVSRDDAEGSCSEVESTRSAALYDIVFSSQCRTWIMHGSLVDCGLITRFCSAPRYAGRTAPCRLCFEQWRGHNTNSSRKLLGSGTHWSQKLSQEPLLHAALPFGSGEMLKGSSSSPAILRVSPCAASLVSHVLERLFVGVDFMICF